MNLSFTDNLSRSLIDVLKPCLQKARVLRFGIAFAKYSGLLLIENDVKKCLENGGEAEFLLGLDFRTTEPKVLTTLKNLKNAGLNVSLFCFSDPSIVDTPVYHPKIYLIQTDENALISVGSSNLTKGGLKSNIETNVVIEADLQEEIVSDIYGIYNRYKFQGNRFEPDTTYIEGYAEAYEIVRKRSIEALKEKTAKRKIAELNQRAEKLPKPKIKKTDLWGWQKLIYDKLPKDVFQTRDLYTYASDFRQRYPENMYVNPKIRQILQQLRDLGLVKHLGKGKWQRK